MERLHRAIDGNSHVLKEAPWLLVQQLYNAWEWEKDGLGERVAEAERACQWTHLRLLNRPAVASPLLRVLIGRSGPVNSVNWSPDGQTLASGDFDNTVRLWDARTGQLLRSLMGHSGRVYSVCWSPDSRILASGSEDRTVRLWDAHTGEPARSLAHSGWVWSVSWSPNGQAIATGGDDNTVRLWDASSGRVIAAFPTSDAVIALWFDPGGRFLHAADRGSGTNIPQAYFLEIIHPGRSS